MKHNVKKNTYGINERRERDVFSACTHSAGSFSPGKARWGPPGQVYVPVTPPTQHLWGRDPTPPGGGSGAMAGPGPASRARRAGRAPGGTGPRLPARPCPCVGIPGLPPPPRSPAGCRGPPVPRGAPPPPRRRGPARPPWRGGGSGKRKARGRPDLDGGGDWAGMESGLGGEPRAGPPGSGSFLRLSARPGHAARGVAEGEGAFGAQRRAEVNLGQKSGVFRKNPRARLWLTLPK